MKLATSLSNLLQGLNSHVTVYMRNTKQRELLQGILKTRYSQQISNKQFNERDLSIVSMDSSHS